MKIKDLKPEECYPICNKYKGKCEECPLFVEFYSDYSQKFDEERNQLHSQGVCIRDVLEIKERLNKEIDL